MKNSRCINLGRQNKENYIHTNTPCFIDYTSLMDSKLRVGYLMSRYFKATLKKAATFFRQKTRRRNGL